MGLTQQAGCPTTDVDYSYDLNGNLTNVEDGNALAYDKRNRTTSITPFGQIAIPFEYADFAQTERLSRGATSFTDTQLGTQIETVGSDRTFYDRTDSGQALAMRTPSADYYLLRDAMGSTTALTDSSGTLVGDRYRYEPYGEQIAGPSVANPIRFQGQYLDSQTGLYKMGLRYYDPADQRWTQKDPLNLFRDPRQANRYAFAGSDPVNNADPSGAFSVEAECGAGPISGGRYLNSDGESGWTFSGLLEGRDIEGVKFKAGCTGVASTGDVDGGGVGIQGCLGVCFGLSSDTGFSFGGGFAAGIDLIFDP